MNFTPKDAHTPRFAELFPNLAEMGLEGYTFEAMLEALARSLKEHRDWHFAEVRPADDRDTILYLSTQLELAKKHLDRLLFHLSKESINDARFFMGHPPIE